MEMQTKHLARLIASSVPWEGDGASPAQEYAESITFDTLEEQKAAELAKNPEDMLQVGGFERLSRAMSMTG